MCEGAEVAQRGREHKMVENCNRTGIESRMMCGAASSFYSLPSGVSRIFVRGVLSFGLLYDCACVNPKCYPCDFRTRRGRRLAWSGVWRHVLREFIGLQGNFLRQFSRTCPDRLRVALQVTVRDWEAFFNRNSN